MIFTSVILLLHKNILHILYIRMSIRMLVSFIKWAVNEKLILKFCDFSALVFWCIIFCACWLSGCDHTSVTYALCLLLQHVCVGFSLAWHQHWRTSKALCCLEETLWLFPGRPGFSSLSVRYHANLHSYRWLEWWCETSCSAAAQ